MTKLSRLLCGLVFVVACGKADSKSTPKAVDEPAKTEPAPVKAEPKPAPKPEPKPAPKDEPKAETQKPASKADIKLLSSVGESTKLDYKTETGDLLTLTVKQRIKDGKWVTDVISDGKVFDTIESGVEKDDIHMEARSAINIARKEGVLVVVSANKVTGKPADYYTGVVYTWDAAAKVLKPSRKIQHEDVYDPETDG